MVENKLAPGEIQIILNELDMKILRRGLISEKISLEKVLESEYRQGLRNREFPSYFGSEWLKQLKRVDELYKLFGGNKTNEPSEAEIEEECK